jgi:hypothetical protein
MDYKWDVTRIRYKYVHLAGMRCNITAPEHAERWECSCKSQKSIPQAHTCQHQHNYTGCNSAMSNKAVEV